MSGKIAAGCRIPTAAGGTFILTTSVPANGKLDPALANTVWTSPVWTCNTASRLTLTARALRLNTPKTSLNPSQTQVINFTARASGWTTADATVTTAETSNLGTGATYTGAAQSLALPKAGAITLRFANFAVVDQRGASNNPAKPIDGPYSAYVAITLTPAS